jgi:hypothetical protein
MGEKLTVPMPRLAEDGIGKQIGTVELKDTPYGLLPIPDLGGLEPGIHGFHVHQNPDCAPVKEGGKMSPDRLPAAFPIRKTPADTRGLTVPATSSMCRPFPPTPRGRPGYPFLRPG